MAHADSRMSMTKHQGLSSLGLPGSITAATMVMPEQHLLVALPPMTGGCMTSWEMSGNGPVRRLMRTMVVPSGVVTRPLSVVRFGGAHG